MDNRTIEEVRKNETKLINEIKDYEQALNEIRRICYGSDMSKQEYDKVLQIIDKVLGGEK